MIVRLDDIHKSFVSGFLMRRKEVLRGLDLGLAPGDAYALLGPNGAGKSTTLRILLGLSTPDRGHGTLLGRPLGDRSAHRRLGYLPENPTFHEQLTVGEFLTLSGRLLGLDGKTLSKRSDDWLERVELTEARGRKLRKLSKGMLQRLGLAQALLGDPELLILDEPMSGLDPPGRKLVRDLILEQRAAGKTVLFSTHILSDAEIVCTRAGFLCAGRIERELHLDELHGANAEHVEITVSGLAAPVLQTLQERSLSARGNGTAVLFVVPPGEPAQEFLRAALHAGGHVEAVTPRRVSLEKIYIDTASTNSRQDHEAAAQEAASKPLPVAGPAARDKAVETIEAGSS